MDSPFITTKEAMRLCKVSTYERFNAIKAELGIHALWRGGEGNVYNRHDFEPKKESLDRKQDAFSVF